MLLPDAETCRRVGDKYLAHLLFEERGLPSPRSWLPGDVPADARFPLLVKVREGFGSRHIYRAADRAELEFFLRYTRVDSFVQECCPGEEFSIDVFCDLDSRCLNAIPRTMIQSKGGESIKGTTMKDARADRPRRARRGDDRARRPRQHPVLPRARRLAAGHRREPALRRRLPAPARGREPLPRAGDRAGERRAARAQARRLPRGDHDDALLLAPRARARTTTVGSSRSRRSCPNQWPQRASSCDTRSPEQRASSGRTSQRPLPPRGTRSSGSTASPTTTTPR